MDVYEKVTNRIIEEMDKGIIPWVKPWFSAGSACNWLTQRPYSIINQILLKREGEYLTFKQAKEAGGSVKKGAKSQFVVFFKMLEVDEKADNNTSEKRKIPLLRYYNVFHISDCENIESKQKKIEHVQFDPIERADALFDEYIKRERIKIDQKEGNNAWYSSSIDTIGLPAKEQFKDNKHYYSAAFHEAAHSTGHSERLARFKDGAAYHSKKEYSREELVAEVASAALLNKLGIETDETITNNAAYIQSWIQALSNDKKMIVWAAGRAEKAVNMIEGIEI